MDGQPSVELLQRLSVIGYLRQELPFRQRSWLNVLGLYSRVRELGPEVRLDAGGRFRRKLSARLDWDTQEWVPFHYKPGAWEDLVEPTYQLAHWYEEKVKGDGWEDPEFQQDVHFLLEKIGSEFKQTGRIDLSELEH